MNIKIGFSTCPNDTFIFDALIHKRIDTEGLTFEPYLADVEELNQLADKGELDVTKMSYRAFFNVRDKYYLLRSGGALGRGCGPLLISKNVIPLEALKDQWVAIPGWGTTANFLMEFAFPKIQQKKALLFSVIEQTVLNGEVAAGLIIHENRFTYEDKGLVALADLGAIWEERTGAPIPLGCIVSHKRLGAETALKIERLIRKSVQYAFENPETVMPYVRQHAQEMSELVMKAHIELYVNEFSEDIGIEGMQAIQTMSQHITGEYIPNLYPTNEINK